jgi:alpha-L-fucosidase
MKNIISYSLKILGILVLLTAIGLILGYRILFDHEMKYYPVEDPVVSENLKDWQNRKFGLFMHWGPYSQWGVVESWSICAEDEPWCRRDNPNYDEYKRDYTALKKTFNPIHFEPGKWANAAKNAGMEYMVFTTKHHDGFCMFETKTTQYKITDDSCAFSQDPRSNITFEIFEAFRNEDFMVGAYFSKADWNTEYYWWPNFATPDRNVNYSIEKYPDRWENFVNFTHTQVMELVSNFGEIDILWFDGGWVRRMTPLEQKVSGFMSGLYQQAGYTQFNPPQNQDLRMSELAEKVREKQPGIIMVDRHVEGSEQDYMTPEQYVPDTFLPYPWESCITMGRSWSFIFKEEYKPARQIIHTLIDVVSKGGNLLLNIGPGPDGKWHEEAYVRLAEIGGWMQLNREAIYNSDGKPQYGEGKIRYTYMKDGSVNAFYMADEDEKEIPSEIVLEGLKFDQINDIQLFGSDASIKWEKSSRKIKIYIPESIRKNPPCDFAWVFKIS